MTETKPNYSAFDSSFKYNPIGDLYEDVSMGLFAGYPRSEYLDNTFKYKGKHQKEYFFQSKMTPTSKI